ncbi:hypothetical protein CMV_002071 [Castanea mollissima]|uniref:Bulb-type lectin domain-containing protein n=1 Tax=Castanea mollissima TaxID=60419 RepID=A0A8J4W629_9ROSI|nr:hypothetical protein CMV_002071 [Castanea mollissima]
MAFVHPHPFVFLLILLPISAVAQNDPGYVNVGSFLTATDENSTSWLSPSGDFAFGFSPLKQKDLFLLSIWFARIPDKTVVWYARLDNPVPRGSKVELINDRGLVLTGPQNDELWTSNSTGTLFGFMNNTGNFVLQDSNLNSLWESFKDPRDTMLPAQIMERGGVLSSRQSENNFSKGRFQLQLGDDGNLVLHTINLPTDNPNEAYYESQTTAGDNGTLSPGKELVFNESGYMYILKDDNQRVALRSERVESTADFYFRATLNFDGVFTQYSHPRTSNASGSWNPIWSVPDNICVASNAKIGSGTCGFNSICTIKPDRRPMCTCPKGYSFLDPNDPYGTCKPDFAQGCDEDELSPGNYSFEVRKNTDWPFSDYAYMKPYTEDQCKKSCMEDCMCAVAIFRLGDSCWKKKLPLSNGKVDSNLNSGLAFIKIRNNNSITRPDDRLPNPKPENENQNNLVLMWSMLLGGSVFVNIILIVTICLGFFFIYHKRLKRPILNVDAVEMNLRCFTYKELVEATDGRRSVDLETIGEQQAILTDWAYDCYQEGRLDSLVEYDVEALDDRRKLVRFVMVALWCIQEDPFLRPTMRRATQMLEGVVEVPVPPSPYPYSSSVVVRSSRRD